MGYNEGAALGLPDPTPASTLKGSFMVARS